MVNFSIIIPHHNIPVLLNRLIDSIPQKEDMEIIVVDDNSNNEKKPIIKSDRQDIILVYIDKKESKGAGKARNVGLKHASGKWVLFADSDDFFKEGFYDSIKQYENVEEDIIYFTAESVDSETLLKVKPRTEEANNMVKEGNLNGLRYHHYVPWSKMIKRNFIINNNIQFEEVPVCNDIIFSILIGIRAKNVRAVDMPIYVSTIRQGSLYYTKSDVSARNRLEAKFRANRLLLSNDLGKYKPNLLREAKVGLSYSITTFIQWLLLSIKEEGIKWFIRDCFNVLGGKLRYKL